MNNHTTNPMILYKFTPDDNIFYPLDNVFDVSPGVYLINTNGERYIVNFLKDS